MSHPLCKSDAPKWSKEDWPHCCKEGRVGGQQQADPPSVAGRRSACSLQEEEEAPPGHRGGGRFFLTHPTQCGLGPRLPVRPDHRRKDAEAIERDRRIHEKCLAIDVGRSIDADGVVACLDRLAKDRGAPAYVRFDHGPEFIAYAVADWYRFNDTDITFIDPGSPWQNAWIESFDGRLRDEYLNGQIFETMLEAQIL